MTMTSLLKTFKLITSLIVTILLLPLSNTVLAQDNDDLLSPSTFISLVEQTTGGKEFEISSDRFYSIVDKSSRILIMLNPVQLQVDSLLQQKWATFLKSDYKDLQDKFKNLQEQKSKLMQDKPESEEEKEKLKLEKETLMNQERSAYEQIAAVENQFILEKIPGYAISISAQVLPQKGEPFALKVENYTKVVKEEDTPSDTTKIKKITVSSTIHNYRLHVVRGPLENLEDPGKLELRDTSFPNAYIDLSRETLTKGDLLEITVMNSFSSPRSQTWKLEVRNLGLYTKQFPTLLLIKRNSLPKDSTGNLLENELDNNFEPAPGGYFLIKFDKTRNRYLNSLGLGIGLSGSFLNFRSDKSLEVGIGPVISFFDDMIQFNYGWNLNSESKREYIAVGIGFLDIARQIKGDEEE